MKITTYPDLYQKYKDKTIAFCGDKGVVVGYFTTTLGYTMLVVEEDEELTIDLIISWSKSSGFDLKDYHGDTKKNFFLVKEENFTKGHAYEIF